MCVCAFARRWSWLVRPCVGVLLSISDPGTRSARRVNEFKYVQRMREVSRTNFVSDSGTNRLQKLRQVV